MQHSSHESAACSLEIRPFRGESRCPDFQADDAAWNRYAPTERTSRSRTITGSPLPHRFSLWWISRPGCRCRARAGDQRGRQPRSHRSRDVAFGLGRGRTATPGIAVLREDTGQTHFRLTDSELERLFIPIAAASVCPSPDAATWVNGFKVDFYWPDLGLVVEADSLRYHRTPARTGRRSPARPGARCGRHGAASVHACADRL